MLPLPFQDDSPYLEDTQSQQWAYSKQSGAPVEVIRTLMGSGEYPPLNIFTTMTDMTRNKTAILILKDMTLSIC